MTIPDGLLSWLKILSLSISSILGVIGLLNDFRNKATNTLTRWGKLNLAGLLLSFLVGIASQRIDDIQSRRSADERTKQANDNRTELAKLLLQADSIIGKNNAILEKADKSISTEKQIDSDTQKALYDVNRSMHLLDGTIQVEYSLRIDLSRPASLFMRNTMDRLAKENPDFLFNGLRGKDTYMTYDKIGKGHRATFSYNSPLLEDPSVRGLAHIPFTLEFSREAPDSPNKQRGRSVVTKVIGHRHTDSVFYSEDKEATNDFLAKAHTGWSNANNITFDDTEPFISYRNIVPITFHVNEQDTSGFLSAIDLAGSYLWVFSEYGNAMTFCYLKLKLGPNWYQIPLNEKHDTMDGGFYVRFPGSIAAMVAMTEKATRGSYNACTPTGVGGH